MHCLSYPTKASASKVHLWLSTTLASKHLCPSAVVTHLHRGGATVVAAFRGPANGVTVQQRWRKDARALEREEEVCALIMASKLTVTAFRFLRHNC